MGRLLTLLATMGALAFLLAAPALAQQSEADNYANPGAESCLNPGPCGVNPQQDAGDNVDPETGEVVGDDTPDCTSPEDVLASGLCRAPSWDAGASASASASAAAVDQYTTPAVDQYQPAAPTGVLPETGGGSLLALGGGLLLLAGGLLARRIVR